MLILLSHVFHHSDEVLIGHEVSGSSSGRELEFSSAIRFTYTRIIREESRRYQDWRFQSAPIISKTEYHGSGFFLPGTTAAGCNMLP